MTLTRRTRLAALVALLVVGALGWWRFGTHYVPEGQPPLATMDAGVMATLKEEFNRASDAPRMIVLLSPT